MLRILPVHFFLILIKNYYIYITNIGEIYIYIIDIDFRGCYTEAFKGLTVIKYVR